MSSRGKGILNLVLACIDGIAAAILFSVIAEKEGDWTFFFDEYAQDEVKAMTIFAWIAAISGLVSLIESVVHFSKAEDEEKEAEKEEEKKRNEIFSAMRAASQNANNRLNNREVLDPKNAVKCIFCGEMTVKDHPFCQHCGRRQD